MTSSNTIPRRGRPPLLRSGFRRSWFGRFRRQAADAVFPTGSRVGLVPPPGMVPSTHFDGFRRSREQGRDSSSRRFRPKPSLQLEKSMVPDDLKKQGIDTPRTDGGRRRHGLSAHRQASRRRDILWQMAVGRVRRATSPRSSPCRSRNDNNNYTDQSRARYACDARGARQRARRGAAEPVAVHGRRPGRISHRRRHAGPRLDAGRCVGRWPSGKAPQKAMTSRGTTHRRAFPHRRHAGRPRRSRRRENFARVAFDQIGGIKDVRIQDAEPLRIERPAGLSDRWPKPRIREATPTSWSCNGCASAPAATCK